MHPTSGAGGARTHDRRIMSPRLGPAELPPPRRVKITAERYPPGTACPPGWARYLGLNCIAIACSTREMSVDLVDFLPRASHLTTGTFGLTDRASWTSWTLCGNSPWKPLTATMKGRPAVSK